MYNGGGDCGGGLCARIVMASSSPLTAIADSFEGLAKLVGSLKEPSQELRLDALCDACSLVSVLFGSLGLAFKFAELEYVSKVIFLFSSSSPSFLCVNIKQDEGSILGIES